MVNEKTRKRIKFSWTGRRTDIPTGTSQRRDSHVPRLRVPLQEALLLQLAEQVGPLAVVVEGALALILPGAVVQLSDGRTKGEL